MGTTSLPDLRLIVTRHGLILDERAVDQDTLTVGRDPDCDLVLDDVSTSRRVARFRVLEGELWVEDAGSLDGIRVNGAVVDREIVRPGDRVELGPFTIELGSAEGPDDSRGPSATGGTARDHPPPPSPGTGRHRALGWLVLPDGARYELSAGTHVIGRGRECDVLLSSPAVSSRHAVLEVGADHVMLRDLGSTNGTLVNGVRVGDRALTHGDTVTFANVSASIELVDAGAAPAAVDHGERPVDAAGRTPLTGADPSSQPPLPGDRSLDARGQPAARAASTDRGPEKPKPRRLLLVLIAALAALVVGVVGLVILTPTREAPSDPGPPAPPTPAAAERPNPADLFDQGTASFARDRVYDAIDLWEQAILLDPENVEYRQRYAEVLYRVGYVLEGAGRLDEARAQWSRLVDALAEHPDNEYVVQARARLDVRPSER